jgi:hypothetical protein
VGTARFGLLGPLPREDLTELRRQQVDFHNTVAALDRENSWLAVPALAPAAAVLGLQGAGLLAGRLLARQTASLPLNFLEREALIRGGNTYAARIGQMAHNALRDRLKQKPGWEYEQRHAAGLSYVKPDVTTPRNRLMELKPNTVSGRQAAEAAVKRYKALTKQRTRAIYYDPSKIK